MRNHLTLILLLAAAVLVAVLFAGVGEGKLFRVNLKAPVVAQAHEPEAAPETGTGKVLKSVSATQVETLLVKPHYMGTDVTGRRWDLLADNASQAGDTSGSVVVLTNVSATYADPSRTDPLGMVARTGTYAMASKTLVLEDDVVITGNGLVLRTPMVTAELVGRTAEGSRGVTVTGDVAHYGVTLSGDHFSIDHAAGRVTLTGNVKANLVPKG